MSAVHRAILAMLPGRRRPRIVRGPLLLWPLSQTKYPRQLGLESMCREQRTLQVHWTPSLGGQPTSCYCRPPVHTELSGKASDVLPNVVVYRYAILGT